MTAKVLIFLYLRIIILLNKRKRVARRSHRRLFKKQPLGISRCNKKNEKNKKKMITLKNLVVGYPDGRHTRQLNHAANEEAHDGMLTCLIGANGAGKSTLLRTIAGFQLPLEGTVLLGGDDVRALSPRQRAERMAVVLTDRPDVMCTTVWEMVATGRAPFTGFWGRLSGKDRDIVTRSLRLVGIEWMADRTVASLSDGERQKVMIAKALAQQTPIILLDEPTAFLDYPSRVEAMQLLLNIAHEEHKTVLLSTHDLDLAIHTADRLWLFEKERWGGEKEEKTNETDREEKIKYIEKEGNEKEGTNKGKEIKEEKEADKGKEINAKSTLISGTPQELVSNGSISRFAKGALKCL